MDATTSPSPKQNVLQCSVFRRMRCLFAVAYPNLCKLELCKHLGHGNKAFSSRRRCRTRFGGYSVSCAAHVGTIAGERAGARSASYEIGLSFCLSGKKIAPCSNIGTRGYPAMFGSITRTSFCFRFLPCAEALRCTRTPTAGRNMRLQNSAPLRAVSGAAEPCLLPNDSVHRTHLHRFR